MTYRSTQRWFDESEIKRELTNHLDKDREICMLEIGTFEGASTTFIADNFLDHDNSTLDAVDPFLGIEDNDHSYCLTDLIIISQFVKMLIKLMFIKR